MREKNNNLLINVNTTLFMCLSGIDYFEEK